MKILIKRGKIVIERELHRAKNFIIDLILSFYLSWLHYNVSDGEKEAQSKVQGEGRIDPIALDPTTNKQAGFAWDQ